VRTAQHGEGNIDLDDNILNGNIKDISVKLSRWVKANMDRVI
jgi:hypothetical protein